MELSEVFVSKGNRETFQRVLSRGNTLMVTAVEVDFAFAPDSTVIRTCNAILSAAALWRSQNRCQTSSSHSALSPSQSHKVDEHNKKRCHFGFMRKSSFCTAIVQRCH